MADGTRWGSQPGHMRVGANGDSPGRLVPALDSTRHTHPEADLDSLGLTPADPSDDDNLEPEPAAPLALNWEELTWDTSSSRYATSRSQREAIRPTYRAAVPPKIADLLVDLDPAVAAEADDARAQITRFDAELSTRLPDTEIAPLASVLLRTESASSSQIENITTGAKALALAEIGYGKHGSNASLVVSNVAAMTRAMDLAGEVTPETILIVHEALTRGQAHARPGEYRTEQVWIGGGSLSPHNATFVPPHHHRVADGIEDMCAFARRTDVPLLTQAAIAHAQFETIHPFNDGNGRTGRALVHIILRNGGATSKMTVPVSAGLLADTDAYFDALGAYRQGDPNPIVRCFSQASFAAIANGRALTEDLHRAYTDWQGRISARSDAAVWRVAPLLLSQPALTSALVQARLGISQPAADNALKQLREAGVVTAAKGIQRGAVWIAEDVLGALDDFAARARRRH